MERREKDLLSEIEVAAYGGILLRDVKTEYKSNKIALTTGRGNEYFLL